MTENIRVNTTPALKGLGPKGKNKCFHTVDTF